MTIFSGVTNVQADLSVTSAPIPAGLRVRTNSLGFFTSQNHVLTFPLGF